MRYERSTGSPGISLVYNTLFRSFPLFRWTGNSIATCLHDETPSSINSFALCSFSRYCLIPTTPLSHASFLFRRRLEWDRVAEKTAHRKTRDPERLPTNSRPGGHVKADLLPLDRSKEVHRTTKKQAWQLL